MKKSFLIVFTMLVIMALCGCSKKCGAGCGENANPDCSAGMCDSCCAWYGGLNGCRHTEFKDTSNNSVRNNEENDFSSEYAEDIQNSTIIDILENATLLYPVSNDLFEYNIYQRSDNEECIVEITKYIGSSSDIIVPPELDGYSVVSIGDKCFYNNLDVLNVELPSTLKKIGDYAFTVSTFFSPSATLEKIIIPEGIEVIGEEAFGSCWELQQINLPDSLIAIGKGAFSGCRSLTSVEWPEKITVIPTSVLRSCHSLTQVTFPDTITEIGDYAFSSSALAGELLLPESIIRIGEGAFSNTSITSVEIPEGCTIGDEAFITPTLTKAILPYNVTLESRPFGQEMENLTIYGEPSSSAAEYCSTYGIKFQLNSTTK